jgi:hypothetical protein
MRGRSPIKNYRRFAHARRLLGALLVFDPEHGRHGWGPAPPESDRSDEASVGRDAGEV